MNLENILILPIHTEKCHHTPQIHDSPSVQ